MRTYTQTRVSTTEQHTPPTKSVKSKGRALETNLTVANFAGFRLDNFAEHILANHWKKRQGTILSFKKKQEKKRFPVDVDRVDGVRVASDAGVVDVVNAASLSDPVSQTTSMGNNAD